MSTKQQEIESAIERLRLEVRTPNRSAPRYAEYMRVVNDVELLLERLDAMSGS